MTACMNEAATHKRCSKCGFVKPRESFALNGTCKDGRRPDCRSCVADYTAAYYQAHKAKYAERDAAKVGSLAYLARLAATRAAKRGELVNPDPLGRCESCGRRPADHKHHDSYAPSQWVCVRWLCSRCHAYWHVRHEAATVEGERPTIKERKPRAPRAAP